MAAGVSGPITSEQELGLQRINASSRHLINLINQVLTFNRHLAAAPQPRPEPIALARVLAETAALVEPLATKKGLGYSVRIPDERVMAVTDPSMLRQILLNLLGNAVKYTDTGDIVLEATVDSETFAIKVTDTGCGIRPEHMEHIWEPFWQADQSFTRQREGVGLGLSVTRHLVQALGGDVRVASETAGTTFVVVLPLRARAAGAA